MHILQKYVADNPRVIVRLPVRVVALMVTVVGKNQLELVAADPMGVTKLGSQFFPLPREIGVKFRDEQPQPSGVWLLSVDTVNPFHMLVDVPKCLVERPGVTSPRFDFWQGADPV